MPSSGAIRAGRAFVELFADDSKLRRGLKSASRKLSAWGASVRQFGTRLAGVGAAITAPLIGASKVFAKIGDDLDKMSQRTGIGVEALSELSFAAEQSGADLDALANAVLRMNRRLGRITAGQGSGQQVKAMEALGLSAQTLERLDTEERLLAIADAMAAMKDPAEAAGLAQRAFGSSVDQVLPLLLQGADGIKSLKREARELGLTISGEAASQAAKFTDQMNVLAKVIKITVFQIGSKLAPTLIDATKKMVSFAAGVRDWIGENKDLIVLIFKVGSGLVAAGTAVIALGAALSGMGVILGTVASALGLVGTAVAALLSPLGLVTAAIAGIGLAFLKLTDVGQKVLRWLGKRFDAFANVALDAFGAIRDALAAGDIAAAARVLWASMKLVWAGGIDYLRGMWIKFSSALQRIGAEAFSGLNVAWEETMHGIQIGLIHATGAMRKTWATFVAGWKLSIEAFAGFFAKRWADIKGAMDENFDVDAAKSTIDQSTKAAIAKIGQEQIDAIAEADKSRDARLKAEGQKHRRELAEIGKQYNALQDDIDASARKRMEGLGDEVKRAKADLRHAIDQAHRARKGIDDHADQLPGGDDDFAKMIADAVYAIDDGIAAMETANRGTFFANEAASLQTTTVDQLKRLIRIEQDAARDTKRIEQHLREPQEFGA